MRTFPDDQIRKLRKTGDLTEKNGKRYRPSKKEPQAKVPLTSEERQAQALEAIVGEIKEVLQANSQNAVILLEMIRKLKTDVQLPEPAKKYKHTPFRDHSGRTEYIISERIG